MWGENGLKWKISLQTISELMRKERQRSHPSHATNPDRRSTSTSNCTQIAPFDFAPFDFVDFACLRLRRDCTPRSHAFDFADLAPFDFTDFAEMAPIALRSRLRNGWVLMNLTRFDEFFLVGFWWIWPDLCLSIEKWYYIFVWKLRKCEK